MRASFLRHSFDAVERLHHARTGALLPTKRLDPDTNNGRNSRLIFVDESLIFLRFHQTNVARYTPNGVVLHTEGWYTPATWRSIDSFTPARTYQRDGLRFVSTGWGWDTLYTPGLELTSEGETVNPMPRPLVEHVATTVRGFRPKARRYAAAVVREWDRFNADPEMASDGCENCNGDGWARDMAGHIERGELVLNSQMLVALGETQRLNPDLSGDALCTAATKRLADTFCEQVFPEAVKQHAPAEFEYPQVKSRRTDATPF